MNSAPEEGFDKGGIRMTESEYIPQSRVPAGDKRDDSEEEEKKIAAVGSPSKIKAATGTVDEIRHSIGEKLEMRSDQDEEDLDFFRDDDNNQNGFPDKKQYDPIFPLNLGGKLRYLLKEQEGNLTNDQQQKILRDIVEFENFIYEIECEEVQRGLGDPQELKEWLMRSFYPRIKEKTRSKIENILNEDRNLEEKIEEIEAELRATKGQEDEIIKQKEVLEQEIKKNQENLEELKSGISVSNTIVEDSNKTRDLKDDINVLNETIEEINEEKANIQKAIDDLRAHKDELKEKNIEYFVKIRDSKEKDKEFEGIKAKYDEVKKELIDIAEKSSEGNKRIKNLTDEIQRIETKYNETDEELTEEIKKQSDKIESKKEELKKLRERSEESSRLIDRTKFEIIELEKEGGEYFKERQKLEYELSEIEGKEREIKEKEDRYRDWEADLDKVSQEQLLSQVKDLKENIIKEAKNVKELEGKYVWLQNEYENKVKMQEEEEFAFKLKRKEILSVLQQKLEDARKEINWGVKAQTSAFSNFLVSFINTAVVGLFLLGLLYYTNLLSRRSEV